MAATSSERSLGPSKWPEPVSSVESRACCDWHLRGPRSYFGSVSLSPGAIVRPSIRHPAFLAALAAREGAEGSELLHWRSVAAGFLVLRQVDVWATEGMILRSAWRATSTA